MIDDADDSIHRQFSRITEPGAAPGMVVANPTEPPPVIRAMAYGQGQLTDRDVARPEEIRRLVQEHDVTWINIDGLGDAEVIRQVGEIFSLHSLALEDVVNVHQRPKVEQYDDHLFIVARMIESGERPETEQIAMFLGKNYVLTFQEGKPGDCLDPVRNRIRQPHSSIRHRGPDHLAYALLDCIIDHYFPVVESYGERLDELDDRLIEHRDEESIADIHQFRRELLMIQRAIRPHRELINQLLREPTELVSDETRIFLRDCYDHTLQLSEAIDTYRETCSDLRDFHLAAVGSRTNDAMKTLTMIATVFIPLSFIAGLYGMNFEYMPELQWKYGYLMALGLMAAVATGLVIWFRRKDWLRDQEALRPRRDSDR